MELMTTKPIVIGMIGAGFAAAFHVENYRRIPGLDVRIKGVTSKSKEKQLPLRRNTTLRKSTILTRQFWQIPR